MTLTLTDFNDGMTDWEIELFNDWTGRQEGLRYHLNLANTDEMELEDEVVFNTPHGRFAVLWGDERDSHVFVEQGLNPADETLVTIGYREHYIYPIY